jgi:tetratricopeptide (TPR) repeat protein
MYNLLISIASGTLVTLLVGYLVASPRISIGGGIIPGLIVTIGVFIYISRKVGKKLEALMGRVQEVMTPRGGGMAAKPERARFTRAREVLKEGYAYQRWQILVRAQIDGQIGVLHYLNKEFDDAAPYLENAMGRNWVAKAMLGVISFKKKNYDKMKEVFEKAVKSNKKESLLWNVYAFCVWKSGDRKEAIDVLRRGGEIIENDERISSNKLALSNKKKMKMRGWKEMWYQFHLDTPPQPKMQIDRKQMRRGR